MKKRNKFLLIFYIVAFIFFILDFFIHRHSPFKWEESFGFYVFFGFFSSAILILVAKMFRIVVKREEDYYNKS